MIRFLIPVFILMAATVSAQPPVPPLITSASPFPGISGTPWEMAYLGDFDGDGVAQDYVGLTMSSSSVSRIAVRSWNLGVIWSVVPPGTSGSNHPHRAAVDAMGDVDGDGYGDFVAGSTFESTAGLSQNGVVRVYGRGPGGVGVQILRQWDGWGPGQRFGAHVASAGDIDGDGISDVLVASPGGARGVSLFSPATGAPLAFHPQSTLSFIVGPAGDVNGDGAADYAVLDTLSITTLTVYSGAGPNTAIGQVLLSVVVPGAVSLTGSTLPCRIIPLGDLDSDGLGDLGIGTIGTDGGFRAISATGAILFQVPASSSILGAARIPDQDGDGRADLLLAMGALLNTGVYSGADLGLIWDAAALGLVASGTFYGGVTAGDFNSNGTEDFAFIRGTLFIFDGNPPQTPRYPSSGHDFRLVSSVIPGAAPTSPPPYTTAPYNVKPASADDWVSLLVTSPGGAAWGFPLILGVSAPFPTGGATPQQTLLPGAPLHIGNPLVVGGTAHLFGIPLGTGPFGPMLIGPFGTSMIFRVPPGLTGTSIIMQGAVINPAPVNYPVDLLWLTAGHEFQVQ
jgi:hypothetical protein